MRYEATNRQQLLERKAVRDRQCYIVQTNLKVIFDK